MKPFFCRCGTKKDMIDILEQNQPISYTKYVEPFVGGGAAYWSKSEEDIPKVINDLDTNLMTGYELLKNGNIEFIEKYDSKDLQILHEWYKYDGSDDTRILVANILVCNTFGSKTGKVNKMYKTSTPYTKLKKVPEYRSKMQKTTIANKDYLQLIKEHDDEGTYFFLDPPYVESSEHIYKHKSICADTMADELSKIKGKFLLTIDDTISNRNIFSNFNIKSHIVKRKITPRSKIPKPGCKDRSDLIITNY